VHLSGFFTVPDQEARKALDFLLDSMSNLAADRGWEFCGGAHEDFLQNDDIACPCEGQPRYDPNLPVQPVDPEDE
jgi:hypothetical protein